MEGQSKQYPDRPTIIINPDVTKSNETPLQHFMSQLHLMLTLCIVRFSSVAAAVYGA